jgi:hypothetical protein
VAETARSPHAEQALAHLRGLETALSDLAGPLYADPRAPLAA